MQCQRCQQYGHTKNYCLRPYRCVKCGQSHKTSDCIKRDRNTPAQCALCDGPHPANYKGCEVYKEILARRSQKTKLKVNYKQQTQQTTANENNQFLHQREDESNNQQSYAKILQSPKTASSNALESSETTNAVPYLEQLLLKQNEKFNIILQQMSSLMSLIVTLVEKLSK